MAVESVTVVAPEVRVGPFILSKGTSLDSIPSCHRAASHSLTGGVLCVVCRLRGDDWQLSDSELEGFHCHWRGPLPQCSRRLLLPHSDPSQAGGQLALWRASSRSSLCCFSQWVCSFLKVGDVRVRFSFAGLSSETSALGPAQTVSQQRGAFSREFSIQWDC